MKNTFTYICLLKAGDFREYITQRKCGYPPAVKKQKNTCQNDLHI